MELNKELLNLCPVPMVIVDDEDTILFINESFTHLLGYDMGDLPGVDQWFVLAYPEEGVRIQRRKNWQEASVQFKQKIDFNLPGRMASVTCKDGSAREVEIYGANVGQKQNIVILVDVTERERYRQEKEALILDLNRALAEVKTLRGILPLCSVCKKIRIDKDSWEDVDVYIHNHSEAEISHSICPECRKKLYPELADK